MKTKLPPDAPRAYSKAMLGREVQYWMRKRGWLMPRPTDQAARAYRIAELRDAPPPRVDILT